MNTTKPWIINRFASARHSLLAVSIIILCGISSPPVLGQTGSGLQAETYAGLTIIGEIGKVYSIEYVPDIAQTNGPSDWRCLEYLQLPASPYLWADKSAPAITQRFYRAVAMEAPTNMVFIPPGTFRMGSPEDEVDRYELVDREWEGPQTDVVISRGFWMGKYEVTQAEYLAVMGNNPSWFNGDRTEEGWQNFGTDLRRPVEQVSWDDATEYCAKLTERERMAGRIAPNSAYRLPTEAEWEYACRGWTSTRFSFGDDPGYTNLWSYAWYGANSGGRTHPVGQKRPNPWGLHDMPGNVWEWCQDWFGNYPGGIAVDPQGPASPSQTWDSFRVTRGGVWSGWDVWRGASGCRSASRDGGLWGSLGIGFRAVLATGRP